MQATPSYGSRAVRWMAALSAVANIGLSACASTSGLENELSKLRRDLADVRKDLQDTKTSVQRLEGQVTLLSLDHRPGVGPAPTTEVAGQRLAARRGSAATADPRHAGQRTEAGRVLPVVRLSNKAEVQRAEDASPDVGAQDDGSPPVLIRVRGDEEGAGERIAVDHDVLKHPDPVLGKRASAQAQAERAAARRGAEVAPPDRTPQVQPAEATSAEIEAEYNTALSRLRADHKPDEAFGLFEAFRDKHPRANLADNALYWSGECRFQTKAYAEAIGLLEKLVRDRPRSPKVPDALARIGDAWIASGDPAKAEIALKQVIESYPRSEAAGRAKAALEALGPR